jgi:gluconolactonase
MLGLEIDEFQIWGAGLGRPEDVAVDRNQRVFASDARSAVSEIDDKGNLRRIGNAGGEPNGINLTIDGEGMIIANWIGHVVQKLDLDTGVISVLCDSVGDRPLTWPNYPIVARDGTIYCTSSTRSATIVTAIVEGTSDGYIFRIAPDGAVDLLVDDLLFPNGLALDEAEEYLYCVRTSAGDIVRFPLLPDGRLGQVEPYGPPMGERKEYGEEAIRAVWGDNEVHTEETIDPSVFFRWGLTDGCAFDAEGNLWVTTSQNRLKAITPTQESVVLLEDPTGRFLIGNSNISFGGPDLCDVYLGGVVAPHIVKGRSPIPGQPLAGQR